MAGQTCAGRGGSGLTWTGRGGGDLIGLHPLRLSQAALRSGESTFCRNCEVQRLGIREVQCFALDNIPEVGRLPLALTATSRAPGLAGRGTHAGFGACLFFSSLGRPGRRGPFGCFRLLIRAAVMVSPRRWVAWVPVVMWARTSSPMGFLPRRQAVYFR